MKTKLTSVNILDEVYRKFKVNTVDGSMNLQKMVNRTMDLYNKNKEFRDNINNHNDLVNTGSKF
jgi:hypothetical protein